MGGTTILSRNHYVPILCQPLLCTDKLTPSKSCKRVEETPSHQNSTDGTDPTKIQMKIEALKPYSQRGQFQVRSLGENIMYEAAFDPLRSLAVPLGEQLARVLGPHHSLHILEEAWD